MESPTNESPETRAVKLWVGNVESWYKHGQELAAVYPDNLVLAAAMNRYVRAIAQGNPIYNDYFRYPQDSHGLYTDLTRNCNQLVIALARVDWHTIALYVRGE